VPHSHDNLSTTTTTTRTSLRSTAVAAAPRLGRRGSSHADVRRRWERLAVGQETQQSLFDQGTAEQLESYQGNIERFIGTVKVPVGLAGPLTVRGFYADGTFMIPLATTEATLVASYHRGSQLMTRAGGCTCMLLEEGVGRSPGFAFSTLQECAVFVSWVRSQLETLRQVAQGTTRYGKLCALRTVIEGNHVYVHFNFTTGDAAGQNMVTIATDAIYSYILTHTPVRPRYSFLEANCSGDKKASLQSFLLGRGKRVTAETIIPARLVSRYLRTTPERIAQYFSMGALGGVLSGTIGVQGHFANGLAALYIACGQDAACVAESAVGVTRFEVTPAGDLYGAVTLPNLMVGTVGGGTKLPSQHACLEILGLAGPGCARALAEVCAALCLAGELSLTAALCSDQFARAHQRLARGSPRSAHAIGVAAYE
jgi:hydroxymethylglutaryl-CoA reductase (NADPH)